MLKGHATFLTAAAGTLLVVALFVGLPAMIVSTNPGEFTAPFLNILASYGVWAIALFGLLLIPTVVLPKKAARSWAAAMAVLAIYVWLHGVFQTHHFGAMDGQNWSAAVPMWQAWLEVAVIVVGAVLLFAVSYRSPNPIALFALLLAGGMLLQSWPVISKSRWSSLSDAVLVPELARFSRTKNALVVLMDSMNSDVFEQVVKENPEIGRNLEGFTFFPDTASVSPTTYLAMPTIHSGRVYPKGASLREFYRNSVRDNSVLTKLAIAGYDSLLVNPIQNLCPKDLNCVTAAQALRSERGEVRSESIEILDAVLFRLAPLGLKEAVYNGGNWTIKPWVDDRRFIQTGVMHNFFLEEFAQSISVNSNRPTLKFLHLLNTHAPSVYTSECTYAGGPLERNRENYLAQVKCSLNSFGKLIQALKAREIFDQTAIILLADHGNLVVPSARTSMKGRAANIIGVANPTFAVKPIGARGPFRVAGGEIHLSDFGATLCDLLRDCSVEHGISALKEPTGRVRHFNFYRWKNEFWAAASIEMIPYEIRGPLVAESNWRRNAPIKVGEIIDFGADGKSTPFVWAGFSSAEQRGTWTNDKVATLVMKLDHAARVQLQLHASGFVAGGPVRASVIVNDIPIGEMVFDATRPEGRFAFDIPDEAHQDGPVKIEFVINEPKSPASLGLSRDTRDLGIMLHNLKIASREGSVGEQLTGYPHAGQKYEFDVTIGYRERHDGAISEEA